MKTQLSIIAVLLVSATYLGSKKAENSNVPATQSTGLAYFSAQQLGNDYQLTWATNSEQKESRLELEKSVNERQFETLAVYKGADKNALKTYAYMDTTPFARTAHEVKIIYYRLKQVDANQVFTYSKVISIVRDEDSQPNPTL
jgi:predicted dithiol-disulfide oxidoreductase (DUF899 family)